MRSSLVTAERVFAGAPDRLAAYPRRGSEDRSQQRAQGRKGPPSSQFLEIFEIVTGERKEREERGRVPGPKRSVVKWKQKNAKCALIKNLLNQNKQTKIRFTTLKTEQNKSKK